MSWMKKGLMIGGVAALLVGCGSTQQQRNSASSGSLALSTDDSLLYAADTDNNVLVAVNTKTNLKEFEVAVGTRPMRVVVGPDDTIFVANRGSRSVSVIRKGERTVAGDLATGVDPTGMAVSFDGKTLYVVSATAKDSSDYGTLQAFDTATLEEKYSKEIGYEPRAIALITNEKALVTQLRGDEQGADLIEVDLRTGDVMNGGKTGLYGDINASYTNGGNATAGFSKFSARAMTDVVVEPNGGRAFVPTVWAREDDITRQPSSSGGYYSAGGPCNLGSVATAGIVTVNTAANSAADPKVDDLTNCAFTGTTSTEADYPPTAVGAGSPAGFGAPTVNTQAVQGPSAAAVDPTGEWLFVVNKETSNVAVMPAWRRQGRDGENINVGLTGSSFRSVPQINTNQRQLNSGADGIAITRNGMGAYVYNQFDHTVVRLVNRNLDGSQGGPQSQVVVAETINLGLPEVLSQDDADGRRFFHDAQSSIMSSDRTHVACSTCHIEGRDDGHVWGFPNLKVQTPSLVGRGLSQTAPLHWKGEHADFSAFMTHTVISRMGGTGSPKVNTQMLGWLDKQALPENANLRANLTEAQARGQIAFVKAQCNTCHAGDLLTDKSMQTVDTGEAFDTPSLRGLARSAPYMHDGRFKTLLDRVSQGGDSHGKMNMIPTEQEKLDLVEYLKTL